MEIECGDKVLIKAKVMSVRDTWYPNGNRIVVNLLTESGLPLVVIDKDIVENITRKEKA